jgi:hypothetical protein
MYHWTSVTHRINAEEVVACSVRMLFQFDAQLFCIDVSHLDNRAVTEGLERLGGRCVIGGLE